MPDPKTLSETRQITTAAERTALLADCYRVLVMQHLAPDDPLIREAMRHIADRIQRKGIAPVRRDQHSAIFSLGTADELSMDETQMLLDADEHVKKLYQRMLAAIDR